VSTESVVATPMKSRVRESTATQSSFVVQAIPGARGVAVLVESQDVTASSHTSS